MVIDGHYPVVLAVNHIEGQVPQVFQLCLPWRASNRNRRHKVLAELSGNMPGTTATHTAAHHYTTLGIDREVLLHRGQSRKGRGFPCGSCPALLMGSGCH